MKNRFLSFLVMFFYFFGNAQQVKHFNHDWEFIKNVDTVFSPVLLEKTSKISWEKVSFPHTANFEPIQKVNQQWQGVSFYRKFFTIPLSQKGKHTALQFDAAMQDAYVYLNGELICNHKGGYLPFYIDISQKVKFNEENSIIIKLDNRDDREIPPGKPLKNLDFNYYSGIYRNAWLIQKESLFITNAIASNTTAGGGIFVRFENVSNASADLSIKTEVKNIDKDDRQVAIRVVVKDRLGKNIAQQISKIATISSGSQTHISQTLTILRPALWSPDEPNLYSVSVEVMNQNRAVDRNELKIGIRSIKYEAGKFYLNGTPLKMRGTNRHQDYPYVGNAVSDNAQYRDAWKIKSAGFNLVRSSHYPHSPAFLSACDELGIMVIDAIPGWQFVGNELFQQRSLQDVKDMIRRDRNHSSIVLWEASLNESGMKKDYMEKAHQIVHEELPFDGVYSAGWIDNVYDVFLPARQHGKAPDYWKKYSKNKPFLIAEYGDWEYYAQNAGFNQTAYKDLQPEERTSRQLRGGGEKRLIQQALNYQEAHNDNLASPAVGDANWLMFDYNRGYAPDIESSGIMDMVRLPKFAYYFYQSQIDPIIKQPTAFNKPMIKIAHYWQPSSDSVIRIFSNCEEVELLVNGKSLGKKQPDKDRYSTHLKHPPFSFSVSKFLPGNITAIGYINGNPIVKDVQSTPEEAYKIHLKVDYSGKQLQAGQNDVVFIYAEITDRNGVIVPDAQNIIDFETSGDAQIIATPSVKAEAGIAAILLKAGNKKGMITVKAKGEKLTAATLNIKVQ